MSYQSLLYDRCDVYISSYTTNQIGEQIKSSYLLKTIPCRWQRISGNNVIFADGISTKLDYRVFCNLDFSFEEWDYLLYRGKKYKIYSADDDDGLNEDHHTEVLVYLYDMK